MLVTEHNNVKYDNTFTISQRRPSCPHYRNRKCSTIESPVIAFLRGRKVGSSTVVNALLRQNWTLVHTPGTKCNCIFMKNQSQTSVLSAQKACPMTWTCDHTTLEQLKFGINEVSKHHSNITIITIVLVRKPIERTASQVLFMKRGYHRDNHHGIALDNDLSTAMLQVSSEFTSQSKMLRIIHNNISNSTPYEDVLANFSVVGITENIPLFLKNIALCVGDNINNIPAVRRGDDQTLHSAQFDHMTMIKMKKLAHSDEVLYQVAKKLQMEVNVCK